MNGIHLIIEPHSLITIYILHMVQNMKGNGYMRPSSNTYIHSPTDYPSELIIDLFVLVPPQPLTPIHFFITLYSLNTIHLSMLIQSISTYYFISPAYSLK